MSNPDRARLAGTACLAGGVLQLASIATGLGTRTPPAGLVIWGLAMVCLMGGPLGLLALRAAGGRRLGYFGAGLALLGQATQVAGMVYIAVYPALEDEQLFTPLGAQAIWIGMLLLGVATVRAGALTGWRRLAPLAVPAYFVAQVVAIQIPFYFSKGLNPNYAVLGAWGLAWIVLGLAIRTTSSQRSAAGTPAATTS